MAFAIAIAGAGLALTAASTVSGMLGKGASDAAAGQSAVQQAAWQSYNNQLQARAASQQAAWQRSLAQQKLTVDQRAATDTQQQGDIAARQSEVQTQIGGLRTAAALGSARARLAGSGVDLSGSASDVLGDIAAQGMFSKEMGDFNTGTIRSNTTRAVYGHQLDQTNDENAIALAQAAQDNAKPGLVGINYTPSTSPFTQGATALAGASNLASKWWQFQQQGGFGSGTSTDPFLDTSLNNPAAAWASNTGGAITVDPNV